MSTTQTLNMGYPEQKTTESTAAGLSLTQFSNNDKKISITIETSWLKKLSVLLLVSVIIQTTIMVLLILNL